MVGRPERPSRGPETLPAHDALYNHLVLPAKLPHRQDPNLLDVSRYLLNRLGAASQVPIHVADNPNRKVWESVHRCILACEDIHRDNRIDRTRLLSRLRTLAQDDFLILHIDTQNAGLIIKRDIE